MLQDLVLAAVNEASRRVDEEFAKQIKDMTGSIPGVAGLAHPGLFRGDRGGPRRTKLLQITSFRRIPLPFGFCICSGLTRMPDFAPSITRLIDELKHLRYRPEDRAAAGVSSAARR